MSRSISSHRAVNVALTISVIALILSLAVMAYAGTANNDRVRDISALVGRVQTSRFEASYQTCLVTNAQNRTIIRFVIGLAPELEQQTRRTFHVEPDCRAWARERVGLTR